MDTPKQETVTVRGYEIVITEKRTIRRMLNREWVVVGQENGKPKYGYAPAIEGDSREEREVLKQTVDALDLKAVLKAINGL